MANHQVRSMEAMLDEERMEVLALLEGHSRPGSDRAPRALGARSPSPYTHTHRSQVRSMLDIGGETSSSPMPSPSIAPVTPANTTPSETAPVRSMLDVDSPPASPRPPAIRSMLDVEGPSSSSSSPSIPKQVLSNPNSPTDRNFRANRSKEAPHGGRSMSEATIKPYEQFPSPVPSASRLDRTSEYQFSGIITHQVGQQMPKRVSQGGKRPPAVMAEVMRGNDVGNLVLPGDYHRGRHYSAAGPSSRLGNKSKSPQNRLDARSASPRDKYFSGRHLSPSGRPAPGDIPQVEYLDAYRHLSDANIARHGGSLSELARRKKSDDATAPARLEKDYLSPDGDVLPDDSSDEQDGSSDEGDRGRKAARNSDADGTGKQSTSGGSQSPEASRKSLSLLAAAEEERVRVAKHPKYQYRSLLEEPEITTKARTKQSKTTVHPATSFDVTGSASQTPMHSDTEADLTDIKRAQKLPFSMTPIIGTPESHRSIQIISRGEYAKIVQEAEDEHRRLRKYLCATDLSEESTHALEWTVGTVLRNGDTLIAIYCVDEEVGIYSDGALLPDDPKAMKEQAAAINDVSSRASTPGPSALTPLHRSTPLGHTAEPSSSSPAPSAKERSRAEEERARAIKDISDRVTKLIRKTSLQVRVIVEVIHCKSPKHLITEVIDVVEPTLVILGSRGRSALKGVILGSFSNYLVTKSSVPVMVARKRLRKQSKYKRPINHQVNNIANPAARSLANAKID